MKSTLNSLLLTAAVTLSAAAAFGQTQLAANVPFEFTTSAGVQPAGEYAVMHHDMNGAMVVLLNKATGRSSMLGIGSPESGKDTATKLVFRCGSESGCALTQVWIGDGRGWTYNPPKLKESEQARIAVVYFETKQAE